MALTKGNAATWDEVIHAAEQAAGTEGLGMREALDLAWYGGLDRDILTAADLLETGHQSKAVAKRLISYMHLLDKAFDAALAARPVDAASSLVSAAWDMLHAVEAADAAGELAENIGGELIDALRAELIQPAIETSARDEEGGWYDTTVRPMEGEKK